MNSAKLLLRMGRRLPPDGNVCCSTRGNCTDLVLGPLLHLLSGSRAPFGDLASKSGHTLGPATRLTRFPPTRGKSQVFATSFRAIASRRTYLSRLWEDHKTRIATVLSVLSRVRRNAWSISLSPAEPLHTQSKHGLDKQTLNVSTPRRALHGPCPENSFPGLPQKSILEKIQPLLVGIPNSSIAPQNRSITLVCRAHPQRLSTSSEALEGTGGSGWRLT